MARTGRGRQAAGQLTRLAADALATTASTALSGWLLSAQAGARTTARLARASRGVVPGAELAGELANVVERQAAESRQSSSQQPTQRDTEETRLALGRIARDSGSEGLRCFGQLAKALVNAGHGETRELGRLLEDTLEQVRQLADLGEMEGFAPAPLADPKLQAQLRQIAANPPHRLLLELAKGLRSWDELGGLFSAIADDSDALRELFLNYPLAIARLAGNSGRLVFSGEAGLDEIEAFWRGRRFETWDDPRDQWQADIRDAEDI